MPRGGRRPGAGRPGSTGPVCAITLSVQAQKELATLTERRRVLSGNPALSQRQVVLNLIHNGLNESTKMDELSVSEREEGTPQVTSTTVLDECDFVLTASLASVARSLGNGDISAGVRAALRSVNATPEIN